MRDEYNIRELNPSKNPYTSKVKVTIDVNPVSDSYQSLFEGLCGQSQRNSNVLAVMKKRKNNVFFRFSILLYVYKYSKL